MITHILHAGRTLCGFGFGEFPGEWPAGHAWTHLIDQANATCPECVRVAEEQSSQAQAPPSDTPGTPDK
jgi:hypothetical protein